ncbi:MAG: flippase-like domain-containing protein [Deltaproteobacteria bacterium]|nr:flippase-like domain-containing protein [Deltaproteobacteria bacterium]
MSKSQPGNAGAAAASKPAGHPLRVALNAGKFAVTFGILYYLYANGMLDFSRVQGVLTNAPVVTAVFAIFIVCALAGVLRWQLLLHGQGLPLHFRAAVQLTMIGIFFNTAIPGAVSGDLIKGYYVVRRQPEGRGRVRAFTTLLLDRLLGLSALVFVSFFAMVFNLRSMLANPSLRHLCGLISLLWVGVAVFYAFVLLKSPVARKLQKLLPRLPFGEIFVKFFNAVKAYESCRHLMVRGFFISVAIHLAIISSFILLAKALGGFETVPLAKFFFLVPFGLLVTAIPIAPAGLGTGHAAFLGLFHLVGSRAGADLFTAYVSFQILMSLIGGIFYMYYRGHQTKTA